MELPVSRILWICLMVRLVWTYSLTDEQNLHTALLSGYNKDLRPGIDRTHPLNINASFYLFSIKEFNLNTGKLTLTGVFQITWYDERLSWNLTAHNSINSTSVPQYKLWLPNFININPFDDIKGLGCDLISVSVHHSGLCSWYALQAFDIMCNTDVTRYPFDTQYCSMKFLIWGYHRYQVAVHLESTQVFLTLYSENGIWEISNSTTYTQLNLHGNEEVIVGFHLKRRVTYYVTSVLLPGTSISLLLAFVFIVPPESGERLGYSTTMLLAIVVYLTIIQNMLPESSEPDISILSYVLVTYVLSGVILVLLVIISLRIQTCPDSTPVPLYITLLVRYCWRGKKSDAVEPSESKSVSRDEDEDNKVTWADVGRCFDMVCFLVAISVFIITFTTFICFVST